MRTIKKIMLLAACVCGLACCAPARVVVATPAPRARVAVRPVVIAPAPMVIIRPRMHGGRYRRRW